MEAEWTQREARDGARSSWNVWPAGERETAKCIVPISTSYTPLKRCDPLVVNYQVQTCKCGAVLNPYAIQNQDGWVCNFCRTPNRFPNKQYVDYIRAGNLPMEMQGQNTTMEYILQDKLQPPIFLFVVDIAMVAEELNNMKDTVQQAIQLMPDNCLVGLITFGNMAYVHEIGFDAVGLTKSYAFRGKKDVTSKQVSEQLGFAVRNDPRGNVSGSGAARFLVPLSENSCEYTISTLLENLQRDQFAVTPDKREGRCTGVALSVAVGLLESCCAHQSSKVMLMTGGPCTVGPGMVVSQDKAEAIRSHQDIVKSASNAKYTPDAIKYYSQNIAKRAVDAGIGIDIFACHLDQCGLHEMKSLVDRTGGYMVMGDSFSMHVFKKSLAKVFEQFQEPAPAQEGQEPQERTVWGLLEHTGYNCQISVYTSMDFQVNGMVGPGTSTGKMSRSVSDSECGEGRTMEWKAGCYDENATLAFFFSSQLDPTKNQRDRPYTQFQTLYQNFRGEKRLRVTTLMNTYSDVVNGVGYDQSAAIINGFDQTAAAVTYAKLAVSKCENEDPTDILRYLDRQLIRLASRFGNYRKDDPHSFNFSPHLIMFPQFMYYLRRSQFLQTFNASPDETAYNRAILSRESIDNAMTMIQPALMQYSAEYRDGLPVLLDSQSLKPDVVLMLDSFFHLVVWEGETVLSWKQQGYLDNPEYGHIREMLENPEKSCGEILEQRFPVPKYIKCQQGGSQGRFLLAKVNPSVPKQNQMGAFNGQDDGGVVLTDDVSLKVFMEHLVKLAVQSS